MGPGAGGHRQDNAMTKTQLTDVLAANEVFYETVRTGDLPRMAGLWSRHRPVSCTHPNRPTLFGYEAVMESWHVVLGTYEPPDIVPHDAEIIITGKTALVLCCEDLGHVELMASNSYALEPGGWKLLNHQAAHIPGSERI